MQSRSDQGARANTMEIIDTCELKKGDKVVLPDGEIITFRKMDGAYAQWIKQNGEMGIGNFSKLLKVGDKYIPQYDTD